MSSNQLQSLDPSHQGLEVLHPSDAAGFYGSEKQVLQAYVEGPVAYSTDSNGKEAAPVVPPEYDAKYDRVPIHRRISRKWLIVGGVALLVVILAAVLGGTLASAKHKKSSPSSNSSPTSTPDPASASNSSLFHYTGNIAAASFAWNATGGTRVYYQDNKSELVEAATTDNKTWTNTKLGVFPQNGSALAAAVSKPGYPLVSPIPLHNMHVLTTERK
jgi:hypothetical protein